LYIYIDILRLELCWEKEISDVEIGLRDVERMLKAMIESPESKHLNP